MFQGVAKSRTFCLFAAIPTIRGFEANQAKYQCLDSLWVMCIPACVHRRPTSHGNVLGKVDVHVRHWGSWAPSAQTLVITHPFEVRWVGGYCE